jgi:glyoxylase-like metal-dependent hydrolase (beta-lactamase superfamily II)
MIRAALLASALLPSALLVAPLPASAQQDYSKVDIRTETVTPGLAVLFGAGGNIAVSHGADGTILVDDQFAPLTPKIEAAIKAVGAEPAKWLINTHWHGDHSGGNENFGKAGAMIMAHDHVRERMAAEQTVRGNVVPASPKEALPVLTYHDGITLHLNGDTIKVMHAPHAHTDGDSILYWQSANVFHMGDLFFNKVSLPFIDLDSGGSAYGVLAAADRVLALADDKSVIIPGHGPLATRADLAAYRAMMADVIAAVESAKAAGKTQDEVTAMNVAGKYAIKGGFMPTDGFVASVFNSEKPHSHGHGGDEAAHSH